MSDRDAPALLLARELTVATHRAIAPWASIDVALLGCEMCSRTGRLSAHLAGALAFPDARRAALHRADLELAAFRNELEVALSLSLLTPATAAGLAERCQRLGRMLGGWQRQLLRDKARTERSQARGARRYVEQRRRQDALGDPQQEVAREPEQEPGFPARPPAPEPAVSR